MRYRSPARFFAPLALILAALAVYTLVQSEMDSSSASSTTTTVTQTETTAAGGKKKGRSKPHTYVVKRNDTLSGIAEKTGLSVEHIQRLNSGLDADSLRVGRTLRLRT